MMQITLTLLCLLQGYFNIQIKILSYNIYYKRKTLK